MEFRELTEKEIAFVTGGTAHGPNGSAGGSDPRAPADGGAGDSDEGSFGAERYGG